MDRYSEFGIRSEADEQALRAVRDGFKRAGLSSAQLTDALQWYRDSGRQIKDAAKIGESFAEYAAARHWSPEHIAAAGTVREQIVTVGPAAYLGPPPGAAEDAAVIAKATELLRTDAAAYWSPENTELREAWAEAIERGQSAAAQTEVLTPGAPPAASAPFDPKVAQQRHDEIMVMMRDPGRARDRDLVTRLTPSVSAEIPGAPLVDQNTQKETT